VASPGHRFNRGQFLVVAVAPAVIISVLGWIAVGSWGSLLIIPVAAHLAGCCGDAMVIWILIQEGTGTEVEDCPDGLIFHQPAAS
jgi:hypothetical protein